MSDPTSYPELGEDADLAMELLGAAVARADGHPDAAAAIGRMLAQLDTKPNSVAFGVMHAWVSGTAVVAPLPKKAVARANEEIRLGTWWRLEDAEPGIRIGFQIFAALANDDLDTASALWATALADPESEVHELALVAVLHRCGLIVSRHLAQKKGSTSD